MLGYAPRELSASSAIWARAALTSSALVFAWPPIPHPPSGAPVSSTQVRSASVALVFAPFDGQFVQAVYDHPVLEPELPGRDGEPQPGYLKQAAERLLQFHPG
jgi:hypothetical protein